MRYSAIILLSTMLGAGPLYAQSCGDDMAGLKLDDDGNYVMTKPQQPVTANMSLAPASRKQPRGLASDHVLSATSAVKTGKAPPSLAELPQENASAALAASGTSAIENQ